MRVYNERNPLFELYVTPPGPGCGPHLRRTSESMLPVIKH